MNGLPAIRHTIQKSDDHFVEEDGANSYLSETDQWFVIKRFVQPELKIVFLQLGVRQKWVKY